MRTAPLVIPLFFLCVNLTLVAAPPPAGDPEKDPQMLKLLDDARRLLDGKQPAASIQQCDKVIAGYKEYYGARKEKIYCARDSPETLLYLLKDAAGTDGHLTVPPDLKPPAHTKNSIVLSSTWANAYFMKGFAWQDLGRMAEAKSAVQAAIDLSPANSQYRSELGGIYELEKDWPKATEQFAAAEASVGLMPEGERAGELGHARRGLAYVLVELGKLDEAEKKYQECLAADPNDARAKGEMEYIRSLRAKGRRIEGTATKTDLKAPPGSTPPSS